jgi:hypothetical protein
LCSYVSVCLQSTHWWLRYSGNPEDFGHIRMSTIGPWQRGQRGVSISSLAGILMAVTLYVDFSCLILAVRCDGFLARAFLASRCRELAMAKRKKPHPTMVRLDAELYERVETLAKADRRPVATYLKLVIADAIGAQSSREAAAA